MEVIISNANSKVQFVKSLKDKAIRYEQQKLVVEGENFIKDLPSSLRVFQIFVQSEFKDKFKNILNKYSEEIIFEVTASVMKGMSDTSSPSGILAVVQIPSVARTIVGNVAVLDFVADPGNVGTIIRTCVACGIKTIITINCADVTSSKVVRSSMGAVFKTNIIDCDYQDALNLLKSHEIYCLDMAGENIFDKRISEKEFALVVGNEANGINEQIKKSCNKVLSLPMIGDMESLNAAVSMSVALYVLTCSKF